MKLKILGYEPVSFRLAVMYSYVKICLINELRQIRNDRGVDFVFLIYGHLNCNTNKSDFEQRMRKTGVSQFKKENFDEYFQKLFGDYGNDKEYYDNVTLGYTRSYYNGIFLHDDFKSKYRNIINHIRVSSDIPQNAPNNIWFFGNSMCFGWGTDDSNTIPSAFQRKVNALYKENGANDRYAVVNIANISSDGDLYELVNNIKSQHFKKGDIATVVFSFDQYIVQHLVQHLMQHFAICDCRKVFERPHEYGEIFIDACHVNSRGYQVYAEKLFETFESHNKFDFNEYIPDIEKINASVLNIPSELLPALNKYVDDLAQHRPSNGKTGAIVVNCNPFTLGHRYLIEQSAQKVDNLFIFVVEEDKSVFPFADRFDLVKKGTKDLPNVTVLPSGRFIISQLTFSAYFNKEERQDQTVNPSDDVEIFAVKIAPALGISVRFAGEEPYDIVTRQYNATMARILPAYGVSFEVIPRKESDGAAISATHVRKLLKLPNSIDKWTKIKEFVPRTTLEYLQERFKI